MKKLSLILLILPFLGFSQTYPEAQIGQDIIGETAYDWFGYSVSLSENGSILAIGAPQTSLPSSTSGYVRVFENTSGTWTQIGQDIDGESTGDQSGSSISLSSDGAIVAIGAPDNDDNGVRSGHTRIYENISGTWTQIGQDIDGEISGESTGDQSGSSVSLSSDGTIVAIGATHNDGNAHDSGHVRIYENISGTWTQIGQDIDGESSSDQLGGSVSLSVDGDIVAIGASLNSLLSSRLSYVRVYENISGIWTQIGEDINSEATGDRFGHSVSLSSDGTIVAIGATHNDGNGPDSGHVRVYENISGTWTQIGQDIDGESAGNQSGGSVSLSSDGSIVVIGARLNPGNGVGSGHVRVYENISGTWTKLLHDINGEAPFDTFGISVIVSSDGTIAAIGAHLNNLNGTDSGHVRVYDLTSDALSTEEYNQFNFSIFPNPAKEFIEITLNQSQELQKVNIYNNLGQFIQTNDTHRIKTEHLATGLYYVEVITNTGKATKKLVIE